VLVGVAVGFQEGTKLGIAVALGIVVGEGDGAGLSDGEVVGVFCCNPLRFSAVTRGSMKTTIPENFIFVFKTTKSKSDENEYVL
jgi:hypothetical protein